MKSRPIIPFLDSSVHNNKIIFERSGGAARAWILPNEKFILTVLPDSHQASVLVSDFRVLFTERKAFLLNELPLSSRHDSSEPLLIERGETIKNWKKEGGILAATPGALMSPCMFGKEELKISKGEIFSSEKLSEWLEKSGYKRSDLVWSPGQYIRRGFIIDVFDPAYSLPLRIEFFDDIIERIGSFRPATQKSAPDLMSLDEIVFHGISSNNKNKKENLFFPVDLLPKDTLIIFFDTEKIEAQAISFQWLWNELFSDGNNFIFNIKNWTEIFNSLVIFKNIRISDSIENSDAELNISEIPAFKGNSEILSLLCDDFESKNFKILVYTLNPVFFNTPYELHKGNLSTGFIDKNSKKVFISDRELSGITFNEPIIQWRTPVDWNEKLSYGQLVIHDDYGTGVFRGIENITAAGSPVDALVIEFAEEQRLLIPVLQSHKITPLNAHQTEETKLDSLRGTRWKKNISKTRERAHEEAKILLDIFAHRELERRPPLDEPGEIYNEFVKAFQFNETSDQLKAVSDIMKDFSSPFPMDRLLIGDVGFGKTEVALRAAFRAVNSGYQVCVLVPTTILAQQHFSTFQSRLAGFPVHVGLLSRFILRKNITETLKLTSDGKIDILIGTHKLLQKGVNFKNLGLLIIDEEHRFGVMHKESLKRTYGSVDILSLSATPIPRTLAMALRGLRSISILSTPPEDRLPVTTFTGPWQSSTARRAVAYELNRGGQVYFLSNRISRMDEHKKMLEAFFPEAKISIAHGQMNEKDLETTMYEFYSGKIDILISTTIIESGLDVGRANTIIIDNSEELGLAQMYQLRGRVGRRGEKAFAYFFYPDKNSLKKETMDRLEAIETMTDLGSGYEIAKRDLDIRGGGDVNGTHQHGSTKSGNFNIFYSMLERELEKLRGKEIKLTEIISDCGGGLIPAFYIPQEDVRVIMYRKMLNAIGLNELDALLEEMNDRFGKIPSDVKILAGLMAVRNFGNHFGISKMEIKNGIVKITCKKSILPDEIQKHIKNLGHHIEINS